MTPYNFVGNNPISYMDPSALKMMSQDNQPVPYAGYVGSWAYLYNGDFLENLKNMSGGGGGGPGGTGWGFGTGYSNNYAAYQQQMSGGYWQVTSDVSGFIDPTTGMMSIELREDRTWVNVDTANNIANGLGIGLGVQQELWGFAVAQNYKTARNPWSFAKLTNSQQAWRTTNALGKFGSKALSVTKGLGVVTGVIQVYVAGDKIIDKYKTGESTTVRDWADLGVNTAGVVAAVFFASNPIGWAVGGVVLAYSIGTTIYDANNAN